MEPRTLEVERADFMGCVCGVPGPSALLANVNKCVLLLPITD